LPYEKRPALAALGSEGIEVCYGIAADGGFSCSRTTEAEVRSELRHRQVVAAIL